MNAQVFLLTRDYQYFLVVHLPFKKEKNSVEINHADYLYMLGLGIPVITEM